MQNNKPILVAMIVSAHGIKGIVKIKAFTEKPEDLSTFQTLQDINGKAFNLSIKSSKGEFCLASVAGLTTRNEAENLSGTKLFVSRDELPPTSADEYYYEDLTGLKACYPDGSSIGTIKQLVNFGAGDILEIEHHNKTFYYPFHKNFIQDIDFDKKAIIVTPIEDDKYSTESFIITVDGPSAAGKGTIAKKLANSLNFSYLDTGLMYRMLGYEAERAGVSLSDEAALAAYAVRLNYEKATDPNKAIAYKSEAAGSAASKVSQFSSVRKVLNRLQRDFANGKKGVVIDGRDIGSIVFPQADCKLYITANPEIRAIRRQAELAQTTEGASLDYIKDKLQQRDQYDRMRAVSPLVIPLNALVIDTTELTAEEAYKIAYEHVASLIGENNF